MMTDLVEILRAKTEELGWIFDYGRRDFQNLNDADSENDAKWYFFLDPISTDNSNPSVVVSTGYYMVLSKSDLDQQYDSTDGSDVDDGKFRKYILPKKGVSQK